MRLVYLVLLSLAVLSPVALVAQEPCTVCSECSSHSDCGPGGVCVPLDNRRVCTQTCTDGCPGDAACWKLVDPAGSELGFCFSPHFDAAFCPDAYTCGSQEQAASVAATDTADASVCRYNGPPTSLVEQCPDTDESLPCKVFRAVNAERSKAGLEPLIYSPELARAAQLHAIEMLHCNYFSHSSLDGRAFNQRVKDAGYAGFPVAENIAAGQDSAAGVLDTWMSSPGHRANILDPEAKAIGIGYWKSDSDAYGSRWVQVFGGLAE